MTVSVRGFRDIFEPEAFLFTALENAARRAFSLYGYEELRIPSVEMRELFVKSTGESTDIVEKEMYSFEDAGGRTLSLRPEGTPGVARAFIENGLAGQNARRKFFYQGSMFRAERPQAGRYREFEQIGVEYLGNPHPSADAETMLLLSRVLSEAGVKDFRAEINSLGCRSCRPAYHAALVDFLRSEKESLCDNCRRRAEKNPLRALDCKTDGALLAKKAPRQELCPECKAHFEAVQELLSQSGLPFSVNNFLVRGLDYYTRTVFEFKSEALGAQDSLAAGGRYDSLIASMGGPETPAVGWAMGADRAVLLMPKQTPAGPQVFVISLGADKTAFLVLEDLRKSGLRADGANFSQSLRAQMRAADKSGAAFAVIIGENEAKENSAALKNLKTSEQEKIPFSRLAEVLRSKNP